MQAAQQAEALGYDSVWAADRLVMPWKINTTYPYSKAATFIVPPDRPFFDTLTCLAFLAGCTEKIQLGMSVMVLPYRHPLHWARIATTLDQLSTGRRWGEGNSLCPKGKVKTSLRAWSFWAR
jgi:alkanesulfonate monooxygenase SsuD/methylene tetrahydromethanopterin reductase-like flavin-dependent oxidoreductase (luciferase family)